MGRGTMRQGYTDHPPPRPYPLPFVGARVRRSIADCLDVLDLLKIMLLLWSGGFDCGCVLRGADGKDSELGRVLRVLQEVGIDRHRLVVTEMRMKKALAGGLLDLVKLCRAQGCPWDKDTCSAAARGGHLNVLRLITEQGLHWVVSTGMDEE